VSFRIRSITAPTRFNTFREAATLSLICQAMLVMPLYWPSLQLYSVSETVYYAIPLLWGLGAVLAWLDVRSPIPRDDLERRNQGWILTQWTGQEAKFRLKAALAVSLGNVFSNAFASSFMLMFPSTTASLSIDYFSKLMPGSSSFSFPLWPLRLFYAGLLVFFAALSGVSVWNLRKEIAATRTKWSKPHHFHPVKYARRGLVLIGQEFERTTQSTATTHKNEGMTDSEVSARPVARLLGFNEAFCIDLVNSVSSHVYAFGATGFGKTVFGKVLIGRVWNALRIPSLILDWKGEYSPLIAKMGGTVLRIPDDFTVNPLKLEGLSPIVRAEAAAELLISAVKLSALQAGEVVQVIMRLYEKRGILEENTQKENETKTPPTVWDVMEELAAMKERGEFKGEKAQSVGWTIEKLRLVRRIFKKEDIEFFNTALKAPMAIDLSALRGVDIAKMLVIYAVLQRIYERCEGLKLSKLRLLVVIDEAHLVLKSKSEDKIRFTTEPLPIRLIREGRKYGFGIVLLSQLATDVLEEAAANVAFTVALCLDTPKQSDHACNWINLSSPEREIYRTLPRGGAFIKEIGTQHSRLVRVQALNEDTELPYSRALCRAAGIKPHRIIERVINSSKAPTPTPTTPSLPTRLDKAQKSSLKDWYHETMTEEPVEAPRIGGDVVINSERCEPPEISGDVATNLEPESDNLPKPEPAASEIEPEPLTPDEMRILHELEMKPLSIKTLQARFSKLSYQQLLEALNELEATKRAQVVYVVGLQRQPIPIYSALKGEWLQSEGVKHRAMQDIAFEGLEHYSPRLYINADYPDIGLEKLKTALEFETGLKKFTDLEMDKWASHVKERNMRLGYERTIVVVPNVHIQKKYEAACQKYGLELTTMSKLLDLLEKV